MGRHVERARQLLAEHQYEATVAEIDRIPTPLRDDVSCRLLSEASKAIRETADLKQLVLRPEGVGLGDRVAAIQRLLVLHPNDPRIRQWAVRLRDHLVEAARTKLSGHQYHHAVDLLDKIPPNMLDATIPQLRQRGGTGRIGV